MSAYTERRKIRCDLCQETFQAFFSCLEAKPRDKLTAEKTVNVYERGHVLFYESNPSFAVYCIHDGTVKLFKSGDKGERYIMRLLHPGDLVGFRAILAGEPYAATAEAVQRTTACVIPQKTFLELLKDSPELVFSMMAKLAAELRVSEEQFVSCFHKTVRERTALLFLSIVDPRYQTRDAKEQQILSLKRNEMAQMIGTTPETFSRTLRDFSLQGLIRIEGPEIVIADFAGLKRVAGE
ncbi:MAG: Crp/Fnr family transcriptional regulator [Candidatus Zixiibacteriota bacterium]|nr:MAG: Crp/Fnr family transcriptional regulator [candidate division Zixibacteria bacterium]